MVGAGAAGLIAARTLARGGATVALLEARDRAGGRIRSVLDPRSRGPIELGPEFVHGRPEITYDLLREAGSTVIDGAEAGFVWSDGALHASEDDAFGAASKLLARALERDEDESVDALVARHADDAANGTGVWTRQIVAGFDAADPARASARAVAKEWTSDASADGAQGRPLGGYAPLVAHLARSLDAERVRVAFETVASRIARDARGVTVDARSFGRDVTFRARCAVVTVPHGVLEAPPGERGAIAFEPGLPPETRAAIGGIAMGPVVKVVLRFAHPFWEEANGHAWRDAAFVHGDGAFPTVWTQLPVRADTLVAWAGGPVADALHDRSATERVRLALACAGRYFGTERSIEDAFERAYQHDWQRDPFARGAYSYVLVGGEGARGRLAEPIDGRLWFAGEATASDGEGGTVAGALESGVRAARGVIAALA